MKQLLQDGSVKFVKDNDSGYRIICGEKSIWLPTYVWVEISRILEREEGMSKTLDIEISVNEERFEGLVNKALKMAVENYKFPEVKPIAVTYRGVVTECQFSDGTTVQAKLQAGEKFDHSTGLAMCIAKKVLGSYSAVQEMAQNGDKQLVILVAAFMEKVRLIDNMTITL